MIGPRPTSGKARTSKQHVEAAKLAIIAMKHKDKMIERERGLIVTI